MRYRARGFLSPFLPQSPLFPPPCPVWVPCLRDPPSHLAAPRPSPWRLPQVFVELNELTLDRSQEPHWRETARWIKFEEDVEEETERWGKPHVASLSFRSLLELRRTIAHGRGPAGLALRCMPSSQSVEFGRQQAVLLLGTPPWSPGPRQGLAATLEVWRLTACVAVSSKGQGWALVSGTEPGPLQAVVHMQETPG